MLKSPDRTLHLTLAAAAGGLLVSFTVTTFNLLSQGHAAFNTRSNGVIWGLPIVTYEFFAAASLGLALFALMALVFDVRTFHPIVKRSLFLAIVCLIAALAVLGLELGHPLRMLWAVPLSLQAVSPMWWKGVLFPLYLLLLIALFYWIHAGNWEGRGRRYLGLAALMLTLAALVTSSLVYGTMAMRPFWFDGLLSVYFLAKDLLTGVALLVPAVWLAYGFHRERLPGALSNLMTSAMPRLFAVVLITVLLLLALRTFTGLWSNLDGLQVFDRLVGSGGFHAGLWAGMVLPLMLLLAPGLRARAGVQTTAAVLVLAGQFIGHYEFVIYGQLVPLFKGAWVHGYIEYTPSVTEWMLAVLAACTTLVLYALGERWLRLSATPAGEG